MKHYPPHTRAPLNITRTPVSDSLSRGVYQLYVPRSVHTLTARVSPLPADNETESLLQLTDVTVGKVRRTVYTVHTCV